jgi:hypothetical protein
MSRVTLMEECPSISETTLMLTSLESSRVAQVRLDWPYLVGVTWLAMLYFSRGRMGRAEGRFSSPSMLSTSSRTSPSGELSSGGKKPMAPLPDSSGARPII